jgi:hypothetical protein
VAPVTAISDAVTIAAVIVAAAIVVAGIDRHGVAAIVAAGVNGGDVAVAHRLANPREKRPVPPRTTARPLASVIATGRHAAGPPSASP